MKCKVPVQEQENKYKNKFVEHEGVKFRSKLEVYCYKKLKEAKLEFEYEKWKFKLLESFEYDGVKVQGITYKPDFVGKDIDGKLYLIECKGRMSADFPLRWKLLKKALNDSKIDITLYMPRNHKDIDSVIKKLRNEN